jgi:hypothetical protein
MSTMTEVIAAHINVYDDSKDGTTNLAVCGCGHETPFTGPYDADAGSRAHAEHVAAELVKAGYGNMADAWDEGHRAPTPSGYLQDTPNPYRGAGHE